MRDTTKGIKKDRGQLWNMMRLNINPIHHPMHTIQLNNTPVKEYFEKKSRIFSNNHERVIIIVAPRAAKMVKSTSMLIFYFYAI